MAHEFAVEYHSAKAWQLGSCPRRVGRALTPVPCHLAINGYKIKISLVQNRP